MEQQYKNLLSSYQIGKMTVKNRFSVSPMSIYEYGPQGNFTNAAIEYFVERARGGFGLIYTGSMMSATTIDEFDTKTRFSPNGVQKNWKASAAAMNDRIHAYGTKTIAQISMGLGRNGAGNKSCSPLPYFFAPNMMTGEYTLDEIKRKIEMEVESAAIAKDAGFDAIDVHAIHWGYLLDQFTMSLTNKRSDEYGGSLENRLRICKEIVQGIKQLNGSDYPVTIRLGAKSFMTGLGYGQSSLDGENEVGRTLEEAVQMAKLLEQYGYDAIGVNLGNYEAMFYATAPMYVDKGYVLPYAAQIKKAVDIPILVAGRMDDPDMAENAISSGMVDAIMLGRSSLADPFLPKKVEMGNIAEIRPCIACNEGCVKRLMRYGCIGGCAVNPAAQRELDYGIEKTMAPKKIMIVGGGIGGMEAARAAKTRGHDVEIYEKSDVLSGNQIAAGAHDFKKDIRKLNDWYHMQVEKLDIPVHFNTDVTPELVRSAKPDAVILATGGSALMPASIQGINHEKSVSCVDALLGKKPIGDKVIVVGGGMVGCEIALDYAMKGKQVSIVEALPEIISAAGGAAPWMNAMYIKKALAKYKVEILTEQMLTSVEDDGVHITSVKDKSETRVLDADTAVISIGFRSNNSMAPELFGTGIEVYEVKHNNGIGNVIDAVWSAYEIARSI